MSNSSYLNNHNLYLNGVIFTGSVADFTSYSDIQHNNSPVDDNSLTNKYYVDNAIAAYVDSLIADLTSRVLVLENA